MFNLFGLELNLEPTQRALFVCALFIVAFFSLQLSCREARMKRPIAYIALASCLSLGVAITGYSLVETVTAMLVYAVIAVTALVATGFWLRAKNRDKGWLHGGFILAALMQPYVVALSISTLLT